MFKIYIKKFLLVLFFGCTMSLLYAVNPPAKLKRACITGNDITLNWHNIVDICASYSRTYIYAREDPTKSFILIGSINDINSNSYIHTGARTVSTKWSYYIVVENDCNGYPVFSDTVLLDIIPPSDIFIDSVSVKDNATEIGWEKSPSADVMGYIIYYFDGITSVPIDTVFGSNNNFYRDETKGLPDNKSESYRIAAFDSCRNLNPLSPHHSTIFLASQHDTCKGMVSLKWSAYNGWNPSVYSVYADDGNTRQEIYQGNNLEFDYFYPPQAQQQELSFTVRAYLWSSGKSSTSNERKVMVSPPTNASKVYLQYVTTLADNSISLSWEAEDATGVAGYAIFRGRDTLKMDSIAFVNNNGNNLAYDDRGVNGAADKYFYQVRAYDFCFASSVRSNISNNILLKVDKDKTLHWNSYINWDNEVDAYEIFKSNTLGAFPYNWRLIASVDKNTLGFADIEADIEAGDEGICYMITAIEEGNGSTSTSNISCWFGEMVIHVPNAFSPDGINPVFMPEGIFIDWANSSMKIFNRWGEFIFESKLVNGGWDGKMKGGRQAPPGNYYYLLEIRASDGTIRSFNGSLHKL